MELPRHPGDNELFTPASVCRDARGCNACDPASRRGSRMDMPRRSDFDAPGGALDALADIEQCSFIDQADAWDDNKVPHEHPHVP